MEQTPESLDVLKTYEPQRLGLIPEEVQFLTDHPQLNKRILLTRSPNEEKYTVNPQQYAFVVPLPSGRVLQCRPRIEASSVLYMLAVAYDAWDDSFLPELSDFQEIDRLLEFVAERFANEVERRLEAGLYRDYIEVEENLPFVRGRIQLVEDMRQNFVLRHRTYCRHSEFTWDVRENQVIRQVAHSLSGRSLRSNLLTRVQGIDREMVEVSHSNFTSGEIERFSYHRLNLDYRPIHRLCMLLLEELSLSEETGDEEFTGFILDMNRVFEQFVTRMLVQEVVGWEVSPQETWHMGTREIEGQSRSVIKLLPDIVIRRGPEIGAVLDCKFKRTSDTNYKNFDFYQIHAYCTAAGTTKGALVYPKSEFPPSMDEIHITNSNDVRIRRFSVNLDLSPSHLDAEMRNLGTRIVDWLAQTE